MSDELNTTLGTLARKDWYEDLAVSPGDSDKRIGYSLGGGNSLDGVALLTHRNNAFALVTRLKDTRPLLIDEISFWASQMSELVDEARFDVVTHAPSSRKVADAEHLATIMARCIARHLSLPFVSCFQNINPRGHRATLHEKLREQASYVFNGEGGKRLLVIDDVVFTRQTAKRCLNTATRNDCSCYFLILYRA